MLSKAAFIKNIANTVCCEILLQIKITFLFYSILKIYLFLWWQSWITPLIQSWVSHDPSEIIHADLLLKKYFNVERFFYEYNF